MRHERMFFDPAGHPAPTALRPIYRSRARSIACVLITACGLAAYGAALWIFAGGLWTIVSSAR